MKAASEASCWGGSAANTTLSFDHPDVFSTAIGTPCFRILPSEVGSQGPNMMATSERQNHVKAEQLSAEELVKLAMRTSKVGPPMNGTLNPSETAPGQSTYQTGAKEMLYHSRVRIEGPQLPAAPAEATVSQAITVPTPTDIVTQLHPIRADENNVSRGLIWDLEDFRTPDGRWACTLSFDSFQDAVTRLCFAGIPSFFVTRRDADITFLLSEWADICGGCIKCPRETRSKANFLVDIMMKLETFAGLTGQKLNVFFCSPLIAQSTMAAAQTKVPYPSRFFYLRFVGHHHLSTTLSMRDIFRFLTLRQPTSPEDLRELTNVMPIVVYAKVEANDGMFSTNKWNYYGLGKTAAL
eukprot:4968066-Amphidinium_carterae.1